MMLSKTFIYALLLLASFAKCDAEGGNESPPLFPETMAVTSKENELVNETSASTLTTSTMVPAASSQVTVQTTNVASTAESLINVSSEATVFTTETTVALKTDATTVSSNATNPQNHVDTTVHSTLIASTQVRSKSVTATAPVLQNTTNMELNVTSIDEKKQDLVNLISPGLAAVIGITCALVTLTIIILLAKAVRSFRSYRFRRLHEVPMDDFDDYSGVYSEHTVPIRNPL